MKLYKCPICGNIIYLLEGNSSLIKCCGKEMEELVANTTDASLEKHIPIYEVNNDTIKVKVGKIEHPMTEEHHITFIAQVINNDINIVKLTPQDKPEATFKYIKNSKIYEYCNIHGLWVNTVK